MGGAYSIVAIFLSVLMSHKRRGSEWEEEFLRIAGHAEDSGMFKHIAIARFASRTLDHELERNTRTVVPYFTSTFLLMGAFR